MRDMEYERRESQSAFNKEMACARQPLADRKEAKAAYASALRDPSLVAERLEWLFDGNYGYGEMLRAQQQVLATSARSNKVARASQLVACYEWQCPGAEAVAAYKMLSPAERKKLDAAIKRVVTRAEKKYKASK